MPARGQVPPPVPQHEQPRAKWEEAFKGEFVKLRPHLENLLKPLQTHAVGALAQHGIDGDPVKAAREWSRTLEQKAPVALAKRKRT